MYPTTAPPTTVGYEVRDAWAEWGTVSEGRTTLLVHVRLHNPSEPVAVLAEPDAFDATVEMNDIPLFEAGSEDARLRNGERFTHSAVDEAVLAPGETQTAVYAVEMDNDRVDEWFRSHVRRGERTEVGVRMHLRFAVGGEEFRAPGRGVPAYTCSLRTAILVDNQSTETACGGLPTPPGTANDRSESATDRTPTDGTPAGGERTDAGETTERSATVEDAGTTTPTDRPPTASATAEPTSGTAPLPVTFDAGGSSDPDGEIREFVWRFDDGSPPARGETVDHTFTTPGEYVVEVTVIDWDGRRDTTTVRVSVERPVV